MERWVGACLNTHGREAELQRLEGLVVPLSAHFITAPVIVTITRRALLGYGVLLDLG